MKTNFTLCKSRNQNFPFFSFISRCIVLTLLFVSGFAMEGQGQTPTYATWTPNSGVVPRGLLGAGGAGVANPIRAANNLETEWARLRAEQVAVVVALSGGGAYLQLKFDSPLAPGTTTFVKISDIDATGISLGVLGLLGLDGEGVTATAYKDATSGTGSNNVGTLLSGSVTTHSLIGADGARYLAITPSSTDAYNSVRITLNIPADVPLLDLVRYDLNVYYAFKANDFTCGVATYADEGRATGVNLNVLNTPLITNPANAIDGNPTTFSRVSFGNLSVSVGSAVQQTFYYHGLSAPQDYFKVTLAIDGGVLDLGVLGNYEVKAYDGNTEVFSSKLQGALINNLDLLGLLQGGDPVTLTFGPGVPFDRISIGMNNLIGASLASSPLKIYSVERYGLGSSPLTCVEPIPPFADEGGTHMLGTNRACAEEVLSFDHANFPFNSVDGNNGTFAELQASSGKLLGLDAYSGHIQLGYDHQVAAGTTSYLKIGMAEDGLLSSLLDGSLGGLLGGVLDNVLFGNHYFTIEVFDDPSAPPVLTGSSANAFNGLPIKIIQDKYGKYHVAITPGVGYRSVKITEHFPSLVGAEGSRTMKVYGMCYSTGSENCEQAFSTYSLSTGISLDLLGVGSAGVKNAHLAIDDDDVSVEDDNTYSEIGVGTAAIGASTFQFVDFHTLSSPADYFKIKLGVENGSLLDVELLNNIEIRAYDGDNLVYSQRLQNGLVAGLDILGLLTSDNVVTIPIGPGRAFDRVAVGVSTLVDVNALSTPLRIFSIKRFGADCPDPNPLPTTPPTASPFNGPDCGVELGDFGNVNFPHNATDGNIDTYATLSAGSGVVLGAGAYSGFIELGYDQPVPALETSYIRIDMADDGLLDALVGGALGNLLADVGNIVLLGDHVFELEVRDASGTPITTIGDASSAGGFTGPNVRIVRDKFGRTYIAYTADVPYQSVKITLKNTAVAGLDAVTTMNVYSMCRETVFDPCEQGAFTTFDGTGLTANLFEGTNPAGVINPQYVIDDNNSNYSEITLGAIGVGVAASLHQDIYFKSKVTTTATDKIRLRMQVPQALANVDILGGYTVYLFNGDQPVGSPITLKNSLIPELDLLGLLNSGGKVNVELEPGAGITYDRIRFEVASLVGVGIASPVRLYNVYRISDACLDPDYEVPPFDVCADEIIGTAENVDDLQNLIDGNHNNYATIRSDAGLIAGISAYSGHLELGFSGIVPAGTSSYIRIGYDEDILKSLLAGSIGGLVNDVLEGLALGDHYFKVIIKDAAGVITNGTGSSQNLFADADGQIRLVQDTKGRYYLEITPKFDYQSIRLEDHTTALLGLLSSEGHLDVYGLCHTPTTFECARAFSTSYEGSGLSLDALGIGGGAGVQNAFWAIDQNTSSASTLSLGALSVLGNTIQQNIQFDRVLEGDNNDQILIRMLVGGGTVSAGILQQLQIIGLSDGQVVFTRDFENAFVEANIYTVLNSPTPADVTIKLEPGESIDEIAILLGNGLVGAGVGPNVSIYHVAPLCKYYAQSKLEVTKDGALADGVDYNEVTATIVDAGGGIVDNKDVEFTITHVDGTVTTETVTTDVSGVAVLQVTSTKAGIASVTAIVGGMAIIDGSPAEVTFVIPNNLSITKIANQQLGVTAGGSTTFTVTITNDGPAPIAIGKVIPLNERPSTGLTITNYAVTSTNASVTFTGNTASVTTTAAVPVAGTITLTITADVAANAPNTVANGIDVWGPDRDPDTDTPDDVDDTPDIDVIRDYGFDDDAIAKVGQNSNENAVAGSTYTYTVTVENQGPSTIFSGTPVYFRDVLTTGQTLTGISYNGSAVAADGNGLFNIALANDVSVKGTFTFDVSVLVAANAPATISNTIHIWQANPGTDVATLPAPDGTATAGPIDVDRDYGFDDDAITKVGQNSNENAVAGTAYTYTVTVENQGSSTILSGAAVYFRDVLTTGQTLTGISYNGSAVSADGNGLFNIALASDVAVNGTFTFDVSVLVAANAPATISNTIHIWQANPGTDVATLPAPDGTATAGPIDVDRDYGFDDDAITKVGQNSNENAVAGTAYTYTVTVENQGPSTIQAGTAIYLQDVVSVGQTIRGITSASGAVTTPGADGEFTFTPTAAIAVGGAFSLTVTVEVDAAIGPNIINNTIKIWSTDPAGDYTTPEGTATTPDIPVDQVTDLSIVKTVDNVKPLVGSNVVFTVVATNNGPSDATGVVVIDELPSGYDFVSSTATVGTFDAATNTWTIGNLANGGSETLTITAKVLNSGDYINYASVDGDNQDPDDDNNEDTPDYPVVPVPDYNLSVSKKADQARVQVGTNTSFTITIKNNGPSALASGSAIQVAERPGQGVRITGYEVTSDNASVQSTGNEAIVNTNVAIPAEGTITLKITASIENDAKGTITNGITIWGSGKEPGKDTPDDEDDTPEIPVDRISNLSITKVPDQAKVQAGGSASFTVTITNNGSSEIAVGKIVSLLERPSTGVVITSYEVISDNGTIDGTGNEVTVTINKAIAVGGTIIVKINADVDVEAPAKISNGIDVWGPDKDPKVDVEDDKDDTSPIDVDFAGPIVVDDNFEVNAGTSIVLDVLSNDKEGVWPINPSTLTIVKQPTRGVAIANADGTVTYTPNLGQEGSDEFSYQVRDEKGNLSNNVAVVRISIIIDPLFIPNTFTPNGDGLNDVFEIKGLEQYSENELIILNRWGNQVFVKRNYANNWAGEGLNEGTYYYIFKLRDLNGEWKVYKGHIALIRNTK